MLIYQLNVVSFKKISFEFTIKTVAGGSRFNYYVIPIPTLDSNLMDWPINIL